MEVIQECCAGLDAHKRTVQACVRRVTASGRVTKRSREFGTMTGDLLARGDWLAAEGVTHVAMESTGVYWKPVYHLLEDRFTLRLCNAQHVKQVPGRKTDVKDAEWLAQLARGRLTDKIPQLEAALAGRITEHHRFLLQMLMDHLRHLEELIHRLSERIAQVLESTELNAEPEATGSLPFPEAAELLTTMPGVDQRAAECVVAEIGTDMSRFPTAGHLASWAGLSPGNHQSAGKRRSGRTPKANRWLRRALTQAAWAASHTKDTYLFAQFRRLAARRGKKRAIVAVGRSLLVAAYHMLKRGCPYAELGADHFDRLQPQRLTRRLVKRLESLGYAVTLTQELAAA